MFIKNIETMNPYLVWTFLVHVMYCTCGVAASAFVEAVICNINLASAFISSIKFHALLFASLLDRKKRVFFHDVLINSLHICWEMLQIPVLLEKRDSLCIIFTDSNCRFFKLCFGITLLLQFLFH